MVEKLSERLEAALALADKATPGPWAAYSRGNYGFGEEGSLKDRDGDDVEPQVSPPYDEATIRGEVMMRDADAIASAVNLLRDHGPALLELVRAVEGAATVDVRAQHGIGDGVIRCDYRMIGQRVALVPVGQEGRSDG
jgi:hypothetical protein